MGLAIIHSRASVGVQAPSVSVEVHISNGMPGFTINGNINLFRKCYLKNGLSYGWTIKHSFYDLAHEL